MVEIVSLKTKRCTRHGLRMVTKQIAFVSSRDGLGEIYMIGVGGQGRKRVTQDLVSKWNPSFSPGGRRIAYEEHEDSFTSLWWVRMVEIALRLTHNEENHWGPAWSPDGRMIAYYVGNGNLHGTIHLMTADGRYIRQLSDAHNTRDYDPDISPLGLAVSPASKTSTMWGRLKKVELNRR